MKRSIFLLSVIILAQLTIMVPRAAYALGLPFGGRILIAIPCVCSANMLLLIRDPRGFVLPLTYQPGVSITYAHYKPVPFSNTVGSYVPGGACIIAATPCAPLPTAGTITMIGTSLL